MVRKADKRPTHRTAQRGVGQPFAAVLHLDGTALLGRECGEAAVAAPLKVLVVAQDLVPLAGDVLEEDISMDLFLRKDRKGYLNY